MLQFMGSQRVRHDWVTELTDINIVWEKKTLCVLADGFLFYLCHS